MKKPSVDVDNGDKIELALDLGQLVVDKKSESISEIELELKAGDAGRCLRHLPAQFR